MSNSSPQPGEPGSAATPSSESLRFLSTLTSMLLSADDADDADDVLNRVVATARHAVSAADLVSITLRDADGGLRTPVQTAPEAAELDRLQYRAGEGPCVDAADPDGPAYALSGDLANHGAWREFTAAATGRGYASVLSVALLSGPEPTSFTGSLNIYSRQVNGLNADARDLAFLLATHASLALANAQSKHTAAEEDDKNVQLSRALDTRAVIGQATGILMSRRGLTADQAFALLSRTSQNHNVKLNRLAARLTAEPRTADRLPDAAQDRKRSIPE